MRAMLAMAALIAAMQCVPSTGYDPSGWEQFFDNIDFTDMLYMIHFKEGRGADEDDLINISTVLCR